MKVLYQSEITGKTYETKEALEAAEKEISEAKKEQELKRKERAAAAKIVEEKMTAVATAQKDFEKALADFCDKYGAFNTTIKKDTNWMSNSLDLLSMIFGL